MQISGKSCWINEQFFEERICLYTCTAFLNDMHHYILSQIFEQGHEVEKDNKDPYYMPASCEKDLYVQLENYKIKKISRNTVR